MKMTIVKLPADYLPLLQRIPLCRALTAAQFDALMKQAKYYELSEGVYLFYQGEPLQELFICLDGCIKLFLLTANGDEKIIELIGAGQSFAEAVLFMGKKLFPVHAVAIRPAKVVGLNARQYEAILRTSVDQCFTLLALMSQRMHWLLNEIDRLTLHNATFRLVFFLLESEKTSMINDVVILDIPKHMVASRLSIKPETLSRILKHLIDEELISVHEQHIAFLNRPVLENMLKMSA